MTPVDPFARPDLPDTGSVEPSAGITESPTEPFDFFTRTSRPRDGAPEAPGAPGIPVPVEHDPGEPADPYAMLPSTSLPTGQVPVQAMGEGFGAPLTEGVPGFGSAFASGPAFPGGAPMGMGHGASSGVPSGAVPAASSAVVPGVLPGASGSPSGSVTGVLPGAVPGVPSGAGPGAASPDQLSGAVPAGGFGVPVYAGGVPEQALRPTADDPPTLEFGQTTADLPTTTGTIHLPAQTQPYPQGGNGTEPPGPLYVVGDVHGYLDDLVTALGAQGIIDGDGNWVAGRSRIWFLGDFTDRGPDGVGVIDLVMRLAAEAAAAGGYCRALMGNHELLLLGAERFSDTPVQSSAGTASFLAAWRLNGGQQHDMERLEDHHLSWLARLPAMAVEDDHLLIHSDTTAYLEYGASVDEVNDAVHAVVQRGEPDEWWESFRRLTKRFAFRGENGSSSVRELLDTYGGRRVVHGHSPIPYLLGEVAAEDDDHAEHQVKGPHVYADELAVAMDGGVTMEGRLLIARLPLE